MFDMKQLDNTYTDPQDQLLIALGVHPDQKAAQNAVAAAQGNSAPLTGAIPSTVTNLTTDPNTGQKTYSEDHGKTWKPLGPAAAPAPSVAPIARPNGATPILLPEQRQAAAPDTAAVTPASPQISASSAAPVSLAAPGTAEKTDRPLIARPGDVGKTAALNMTEPKPDEGVRLIPPSAASDTQAISSATAEPGTDTDARLASEQRELERKRATGSGVSQIKNPFLRAAARIGDVALTTMLPSVAVQVPGTELHHRALLHQDQAQINNDLAGAAQQATTAHVRAEADALENKPSSTTVPQFDKAGNLYAFMKDGKLVPLDSDKLTDDERHVAAAAKGKPLKDAPVDVQVYSSLINGDPEHGVAPLSPRDAYQQLQQLKGDNKPDTATQNKQRFQNVGATLAKEFDGSMPKDFYTNPKTQIEVINRSKTLPAEEKQFALGYMMANPTPASTALSVNLRGLSFASSRPVQVIDTKNGNRPVTMNLAAMEEGNAAEPGRYLTQSGAIPALNKENLLEDIRGGIQQVRDALNNPKMPDFDAKQKVKIAVAMRERDPHSAVSSLITSGDLGTMTPEQEDYLIAHAMLAENAMAMRSALGAGQGSQDLRAAITATFPGPTTPSKAYGLKQLDSFEKTIDRLERGIPNVPLKDLKNGGSNQTTAPAPQGMINVQIPGQPPGHIPASARKQFLQDNPGAKVIE